MTRDLSQVRRKLFGLQLPSNREEARLLLLVLVDFAEAALTLLDLDDDDLDAWARQDWDELSLHAIAATDVLGEMTPTAYRDALDVVASETEVRG